MSSPTASKSTMTRTSTSTSTRNLYSSCTQVQEPSNTSVTASAVGLERRRAADLRLTTLRPYVRHWLRIPQRIQFKVAVLMYKVLHGCAPSYLGPFVRVADLPSRRALRSANTSRLIQPQSNQSIIGDRAFPVAGPQVWNSLPPEVTSAPSLDTFLRRLKTHLFTVSYSNIQLA